MAGQITENHASRSFTAGLHTLERELVFDITGTDSDVEVQALLAGAAPAVYLGLVLGELRAEAVETSSGAGLWKGYARYNRLENTDEYTFDTGGATEHRTQGLATINTYALPGTTAPDFKGAIGVSKDKVEGCDVTAPCFNFSETHIINDGLMTAGYKRVIFTLTGTVNDGDFKGLASGECLFLGASGTKHGLDQWSVTFRFAGKPNVSGLTISDIEDIDADGWDYVWMRYSDFEDSSASDIVQVPVAVYVEQVYPRTDFSTLLIGV